MYMIIGYFMVNELHVHVHGRTQWTACTCTCTCVYIHVEWIPNYMYTYHTCTNACTMKL